MEATIHLHKDILEELNEMKKELKAESHEDVIRYMLKKVKRLDKSHFGSLPKLKTFERGEIDRFG